MSDKLRDKDPLQIVLDNTQATVYVCDIDTYEIVFANKALKSMVPHEIEGRKCWEALSNFGGPCPYCKLHDVLKLPVGKPYVWENYNPDFDMWLQMNDSIVQWADGRKVHLITSTDISKVKQNELKLKEYQEELVTLLSAKTESEQKLKVLSDNMPNTFSFQLQRLKGGKSPQVLYISKGVEAVCGLSPEELGGSFGPLLERLHPEDLDMLHAQTKKEMPFRLELRYIRPNGKMVWLDLSEMPRLREDNEVVWDGIAMDVTMRKQMEEQLIQARNKAEESDKMKSLFMAHMSHEVRSPMNAIIGFLELLSGEEDLPQDEQQEYIRIVNQNANQLLKLISDLLDISKIDAGQMKIVPEMGNLNTVLQDICASFLASKVIAHDKDMQLIVDKSGEDPLGMFALDYVRLRQILTNLIGNAIKFTDQGHVKYGYSPTPDGLRFYVEDTGIGISPEKIKDVGKPFLQLHDRSKASKYGGTGIGLAISRNLVELMGGHFEVRSEIGKGTTFEFTLPLTEMMESGDLEDLLFE